jgi:hypothetical protein
MGIVRIVVPVVVVVVTPKPSYCLSDPDRHFWKLRRGSVVVLRLFISLCHFETVNLYVCPSLHDVQFGGGRRDLSKYDSNRTVSS